MWLKQYHKLPMTGNGKHTTYQNGDDWGPSYIIWIGIVIEWWFNGDSAIWDFVDK